MSVVHLCPMVFPHGKALDLVSYTKPKEQVSISSESMRTGILAPIGELPLAA